MKFTEEERDILQKIINNNKSAIMTMFELFYANTVVDGFTPGKQYVVGKLFNVKDLSEKINKHKNENKKPYQAILDFKLYSNKRQKFHSALVGLCIKNDENKFISFDDPTFIENFLNEEEYKLYLVKKRLELNINTAQ